MLPYRSSIHFLLFMPYLDKKMTLEETCMDELQHRDLTTISRIAEAIRAG